MSDPMTRLYRYRLGGSIPVMWGAATLATWGVAEWAGAEKRKHGKVPWYVVIVGSAGIITAGVVGSMAGDAAGRRVARATM